MPDSIQVISGLISSYFCILRGRDTYFQLNNAGVGSLGPEKSVTYRLRASPRLYSTRGRPNPGPPRPRRAAGRVTSPPLVARQLDVLRPLLLDMPLPALPCGFWPAGRSYRSESRDDGCASMSGGCVPPIGCCRARTPCGGRPRGPSGLAGERPGRRLGAGQRCGRRGAAGLVEVSQIRGEARIVQPPAVKPSGEQAESRGVRRGACAPRRTAR